MAKLRGPVIKRLSIYNQIISMIAPEGPIPNLTQLTQPTVSSAPAEAAFECS